MRDLPHLTSRLFGVPLLVDARKLDAIIPALMRRLSAKSILSVPVFARDELLGALSFARTTPHLGFDERDVELAEELGSRAGVAIQNARRYEREHHVATTLQYAFLPGFLPEIPGFEFDSVYRPATSESQLGGDWYDAFQLPDGRVAISVGDVTGHGLDAATMMVRSRETLRAATAADPDRPDLVLERTNRALLTSTQSALVTALVGVLDPAGPRFIYSCAGHPPPLVRRGNDARFLRGGGVPLGVTSEPVFTIHHATLKPDDVMALYTDGLTEATHDLIEGEHRLQRAIMRPKVTAHSLVDDVITSKQTDDVAVLLVRVAPIRARTTESSFGLRGWEFSSDDAASAETARASFTSYLRARGTDEERILPCEIAFGELVGNVVRHAPGPIEIELEWCPPHPVLRVRDYGSGFNFEEPSLPTDVMSEDGRGLYMVQTLAGAVRFFRQPDGGTLVVTELPIDVSVTS